MHRVEYAFMGAGTCGSTYVAAVYLLYILYQLCVPIMACSSFLVQRDHTDRSFIKNKYLSYYLWSISKVDACNARGWLARLYLNFNACWIEILLASCDRVVDLQHSHLSLQYGYTNSTNLGAVVKSPLIKLPDKFVQTSDFLPATTSKMAPKKLPETPF